MYLRDNCTLPQPSNVPIIIDYGAYITKAGYATSPEADLAFRTYVNKFKDTQNVNSMVAQWDSDIFKNYRSPFEKNLIQHSGAMENINDYIFNKLSVDSDGRVDHPTILTECYATTDLARTILLELMFECYQVPSVMLGVDSLFATFEDDLTQYLAQTKCVISMGDQCVHVVPIVNGQVVYQNIKRLNLGGMNSLKYFYTTIQTRHPHLKLSFAQLDHWHKEYTLVAIDYKTQLQYFKGPQQYYGYRDRITEENNKINQNTSFIEPIVIDIQVAQKVVSVEDTKRKDEIRQKMRSRLQESISLGRLKKRNILENQLSELEAQYATQPTEDIQKKIVTLQVKLGLATKEALEHLKYNLLNVADEKLTPQQLNQKRYQKVMFEQAQQKKQRNIEFKRKQEEANKFKLEEPERYLEMLYEKRWRINQQINERKKLQQEMNTRNSRFNQKRIQTLAYLGQDDQKEDNFGADDNDWELYRNINKDLDSEDEKWKYKLQDLEGELKEIDPEYEQKILQSISNVHQLGMNLNQVLLSVDRVRCQEIYFQPSLIGVEQQGLIDAIKLSVNGLDSRLLQNIYLVGGGAYTQNIAERIQKDLVSEFDSNIVIQTAGDPVFGAWNGMRNFAMKYQQMVHQFSMSLEEYREHGVDRWEIFKQHPFSNIVE